MRVINAIDAEQAARVRAIITATGQVTLPPVKKPKVAAKPKQLLSEFGRCTNDGYMVQIALHIDRNQYNAGGCFKGKARTAREHIDVTLNALWRFHQGATLDAEKRERITSIMFERLSPGELDPDNLPAAMKHVKDAVFAWLKHGAVPFNRRAIGHFDKNARQQCHYKQGKSDANPKAHGIRIHLRFDSAKPSSE